MIKRILLIALIFSLLANNLFAQPGGGGGLKILNIYNVKLEAIDLVKDTNLHIRTFLLKDSSIYQETFIYQRIIERENNNSTYLYGNLSQQGYVSPNKYTSMYLPPMNYRFFDITENLGKGSNQRLLIVYNSDTMIIDFVGIIGENGGGVIDEIDSIVIQSGKFTDYRGRKDGKYNSDYYKKNYRIFNSGLTPYTVNVLSNNGYLDYASSIDISFLEDNKLPSSYFYSRAWYFLDSKKIELSLREVQNGINNDGGVKNCEALFLLTQISSQKGDYKKAINYMSEAIDCKFYKYENDFKERNIKQRIGLYIKDKQYDKALEDYNTIVQMSTYKIGAINEKAVFRIKYLNDYENALKDLKNIIDSIPEKDTDGCKYEMSQYSHIYFNLGLAEYKLSQKQEAFQHWYKSTVWNRYSFKSYMVHLDSMIILEPKSPLLYLSRAIVLIKSSRELYRADKELSLTKALEDIKQTKKLGINDYRINMYKASIFLILKNNEKALKEINIAIKKNKNYPASYSARYQIRKEMGNVTGRYSNDPDIIKRNELCKTWRHEK